MAQKLHELHHEVLAVDSDEERVNNVMDFVTNAQIGDSTNEAFIASLGVRNFDVCVVAIGDNFQSSLETTALLKENGAPFVLARASREVHAKFLLTNGADDVIYPEKQMASWAAVRYSSEHIFDYIELTDDYSIYEMEVPRSWVGSTIVQVSSRQKYRFNILATKRDADWIRCRRQTIGLWQMRVFLSWETTRHCRNCYTIKADEIEAGHSKCLLSG